VICSTSVDDSVRARFLSRIGLASFVLFLAPGCSLSNPGFHGSSGSESTGSSTTTETVTSTGTSGNASTGTATTGGESEGSSSGALTLTESSSTGTGTTTEAATSTGTTAETATGTTTSGTTTSSTSSTSNTDSEGSTGGSGGQEPMTLYNYSSLDSCNVGLWCKDDENQPAKVRHATIECFHSPIAPFEITKLTVHPHKIRGNPEVSVRVFDFDGQQLGQLLMEEIVGTVGPELAPKELLFDPPFAIAKHDFCVGYKTSPGDTQLAGSVDKNGSPPGVSIVRMFGTNGCNYGPILLTDLYLPTPRFCFDVEIIAL